MASAPRQQVTKILSHAEPGDPSTTGKLLALVYDELHFLARQRMAAEPPGSTLQPTALVHEAYLRLVGEGDLHWENRAHFFAAAALAMRRILVEQARKHRSLKRGGGRRRILLEQVEVAFEDHADELIALDEALEKLKALDERKNEIVMLRYFAGLTIEETAKALGISLTTVKEEWKFAKAWLHSEIDHGNEPRS